MSFRKILAKVGRYYSDKVNAFGPTARGADWNSPESQDLRFEQLLKVCDSTQPFSINDYGCGYGALVEHLRKRGYQFRYRGFDISREMLARARQLWSGESQCEFIGDEAELTVMDYTVGSGIFNIRLDSTDAEWREYILQSLGRIAALSAKGFAFNMLTKYSEPDRMRPDLYYADPCELFDYCKTYFSKQVALLHDYGLYEFTLIVRKHA